MIVLHQSLDATNDHKICDLLTMAAPSFRRPRLWLYFLGTVTLYAILVFATISIMPTYEEPTMIHSYSSSGSSLSRLLRSSRTLFGGNQDESKYSTCKYEGHCPVGFTCVKSFTASSLGGGICRPYDDEVLPSIPFDGENSDNCIRHCIDHVIWDEQFYWESYPNITLTKNALWDDDRRPPGCQIRYRRNLGHEWPDFSLELWQNATKSKRIVRVDPVGEFATSSEDQEWVSFCYAPCRLDADCGAVDAFMCVDSSCRRRPSYWNRTDDTDRAEMVIVSGTSQGYFGGLKNLAGSIMHWAPNHRLVVYNLGMTMQQIAEVESWPIVLDVKWKKGFPEHFPPHVRQGKIYAWKPVAINESLHAYHSIFWLDSGSTLVGHLDEVERTVHETGMFLVKGQDLNMKLKSSPATYSYLGLNKKTFHGGPHFGGGTQAHIYPSRYIDTIVKPNAACAMDVACIAPSGSNLANHRYDQSVLSILAYKPNVQAPHHTEYLAASRRQLNPNVHESSGRFVIWTARQACRDFAMDIGSSRNNGTMMGSKNVSSMNAAAATTDAQGKQRRLDAAMGIHQQRWY